MDKKFLQACIPSDVSTGNGFAAPFCYGDKYWTGFLFVNSMDMYSYCLTG